MAKAGISFGITLPNRGALFGATTPAELLELSEMAERSGCFDAIWVGDSLIAKLRLEAITLLSAVAARTTRVKLGPACMASFPLRPPVLLACQWASLDLLSEGRTILAACMGGEAAKRVGIFCTSSRRWGCRWPSARHAWRKGSLFCAAFGAKTT